MSDIIQLLPDSVANQIAAGEVVQRPASVVKELMENAIDAGADRVQVVLKHVGKSLIQCIDNGKGMSVTDARMAFERHATSKISNAQDLFHIHTLGFRGEALPSIASVAEVELRTRRQEDELGTLLLISGSDVMGQEAVNAPIGTNISVKNLFFNIPARRKFLKSDSTELRNIIQEFLRVALTYPQVAFSLENNDEEIYNLPVSGLRQRIVNVFGKSLNSAMLGVECATGLMTIRGFICSPEHAKRSYGEQFFFVNNRFMKHNFFHRAVMEAYSNLISPDAIPSYFLYFTVDPSLIDVNIHPTKTEIKFQNESDFFQILLASIKESLGKFNVTPPLDFDTEGAPDFSQQTPATMQGTPYVPRVTYRQGYTPFDYKAGIRFEDSGFADANPGAANFTPADETLLSPDAEGEGEQTVMKELQEEAANAASMPASFVLMSGRYIVTPVHSGLMFIDRKRAHERILFEQYMHTLTTRRIAAQKNLFPETMELSAADFELIREMHDDLTYLGFELREFGKNCYAIYATPSDVPCSRAKEILMLLVEHYKNTEADIRQKAKEHIALSLAKAASLSYDSTMTREEMSDLTDSLFACEHPNYTPEGKVIMRILDYSEVNGWFK